MLMVHSCDHIPTQWEHSPTLCDYSGRTVAMYFADRGREIPTRWEHDSTICDKYGNTIAMDLSYKCMNIPTQWEHDPML